MYHNNSEKLRQECLIKESRLLKEQSDQDIHHLSFYLQFNFGN